MPRELSRHALIAIAASVTRHHGIPWVERHLPGGRLALSHDDRVRLHESRFAAATRHGALRAVLLNVRRFHLRPPPRLARAARASWSPPRRRSTGCWRHLS